MFGRKIKAKMATLLSIAMITSFIPPSATIYADTTNNDGISDNTASGNQGTTSGNASGNACENGCSWDDGEVIKAPTCSENGIILYTCLNNSEHTKEEITDKLPHTIVTDKAVSPSCNKAGLTEGSHCSVCNMVLTVRDSIDALGHDLQLIRTEEGGCTEDSRKYYKCSRCSYNEIRTIPAPGHKSATRKGKAPTCEEDGLTDGSYCLVCGKTLVSQNVIPTSGHDYTKKMVDPDCIHSGYTQYTCKNCNHSYRENEVPPTGEHTPDKAKKENIVQPTYTAKGSYDEVVYCKNCGIELSRKTVEIERVNKVPSEITSADIANIIASGRKGKKVEGYTVRSLISMTIPNTTTDMEYAFVPVLRTSTWTTCTNGGTVVDEEGIYAVRYKETATTRYSDSAFIKVENAEKQSDQQPHKIYTYVIGGHGMLVSDQAEATGGKKVMLTVTPDKDYELENITATVDIFKSNDNTYTVIMPNERLIVKAYFKTTKKSHEKEDDKKEDRKSPSENSVQWLEETQYDETTNITTVNLAVKQKLEIPEIAYNPFEPKNYKVEYSNKKIVKVNKKGYIIGRNAGSTMVTIYKPEGVQVLKVNVYRPGFFVKKIKINNGDTVNIPFDTCCLKTEITSSRPELMGVSINKVSEKGVYTISVTGRAKGVATISAKIGSRMISLTVYIKNPYISGPSVIKIGKTKKMSVKDGTGRTSWKTSDPDIAIITSQGRLTAVNYGAFDVIATNNGKTIKKRMIVSN